MRRFAPAFALLALAGCERAGDRTAETVVERFIEEKGREAHVEIDREDGSIVVHLGEAIVPENWPDEVPVPPRARRLEVSPSGSGGTKLSLSAEAGDETLAAWYRRELGREGWSVEGGGDDRLLAERDGKRLAAAFSREGDRVRGRIELEPGGERGG